MFDQGQVVNVAYDDFLANRNAYAGKVCQSVCFVKKFSGSSRYIYLSPDGRSYRIVACYSSSIGEKVRPVVDAVGIDGAAIVTYGNRADGRSYIFDLDPAPKAAK